MIRTNLTERVASIKAARVKTKIDARWQQLHYRTVTTKTRFLDGQLVKFAWVKFENEKLFFKLNIEGKDRNRNNINVLMVYSFCLYI